MLPVARHGDGQLAPMAAVPSRKRPRRSSDEPAARRSVSTQTDGPPRTESREAQTEDVPPICAAPSIQLDELLLEDEEARAADDIPAVVVDTNAVVCDTPVCVAEEHGATTEEPPPPPDVLAFGLGRMPLNYYADTPAPAPGPLATAFPPAPEHPPHQPVDDDQFSLRSEPPPPSSIRKRRRRALGTPIYRMCASCAWRCATCSEGDCDGAGQYLWERRRLARHARAASTGCRRSR